MHSAALAPSSVLRARRRLKRGTGCTLDPVNLASADPKKVLRWAVVTQEDVVVVVVVEGHAIP